MLSATWAFLIHQQPEVRAGDPLAAPRLADRHLVFAHGNIEDTRQSRRCRGRYRQPHASIAELENAAAVDSAERQHHVAPCAYPARQPALGAAARDASDQARELAGPDRTDEVMGFGLPGVQLVMGFRLIDDDDCRYGGRADLGDDRQVNAVVRAHPDRGHQHIGGVVGERRSRRFEGGHDGHSASDSTKKPLLKANGFVCAQPDQPD